MALGKTVSAASILSGTLKGEQRLSFTISMSNPKYRLFVDTDANGNVRGYLNQSLLCAKNIGDVSLKELIGHKAFIRVIKGSNMNQFTGITDMPYQTIDDISHYFHQSEQTQTHFTTYIRLRKDNPIRCSYAIYAQLLPSAPIHLLENFKKGINIKSTFSEDLKNGNMENILEQLRQQFNDIEVIGFSPIRFSCGCSKEMFYGMLYSFSKEELTLAVENDESIETSCQICGRTYSFQPSKIKTLL